MKFLILLFVFLTFGTQPTVSYGSTNVITIEYSDIPSPLYSNQVLLSVEDNGTILWDSNQNTYMQICLEPYTNDVNYTINSNYQTISNLECIISTLDQLSFIGYSPEDEFTNTRYRSRTNSSVVAIYINTNSLQVYRAYIYVIQDDDNDLLYEYYPDTPTYILPVFPDFKYTYDGKVEYKTSYTNKEGQRFIRNTYNGAGKLILLVSSVVWICRK